MAKYSNFVYKGTKGKESKKHHYGTIDVTTGFWIFQGTKTINIYRHDFSSYWRELDTGRYLTGDEVDSLSHAAIAKEVING